MPNNLVVVLDPGHGGSNEGLQHRGLVEKDMNLAVANAMKDTLSQFDGVEVYITNPEKADMSLKQRAEYAKSVGADILISLHFNMSESHEMYGSEAWIPSTGLGYSKMHALGDIFMDQFAEMGMTIRGVKTRLNDRGTDYYGVIRESAALNIPCILVEHGYADHDRDFESVNTIEDWQKMGTSDAHAVAKYYGLKSGTLGIDYSTFVKNGYFAPEEAIGSDTTQPHDVVLSWISKETSESAPAEVQRFQIGAVDEESSLVYYDYSLDGGEHFSELFPFERDEVQMEIEIPNVYAGSQVCVRIYNGHFLYEQSNILSFLSLDDLIEKGIVEKPVVELSDKNFNQTDLDRNEKDALKTESEEKTNKKAKKENSWIWKFVTGQSKDEKAESVNSEQTSENDANTEAMALTEAQIEFVKETEGARQSAFYANLFGGFVIFLAALLFLAAYFTNKALHHKYGKDKKRVRNLQAFDRKGYIKRERLFCLMGSGLALIGIVCLIVTRITMVNITKTQEVMFHEDNSQISMQDSNDRLQQDDNQQNGGNGDIINLDVISDNGIDSAKQEEQSEPEIDLSVYPLLLTEQSEKEMDALVFPQKETVEYTTVYDIAEGLLRVPLLSSARRNPYNLDGFSGSGISKNYTSQDGRNVLRGIDVSKFQGDINWEEVRGAGVDFAIMRLGLRGYGSGELVTDDKFYVNQAAASEQGIRTGVYFFSQAINEQEAIEEANYVLNTIHGLDISMPIVFDTEPILYDDARTDHLTPNQLTKITRAFCDTIKAAGYQPMIYANSKRFTTVLHLEQLQDYSFWLADYREKPDYPYDFSMWQFTEKGQVPGIEGNVDIDLYFE